jgi:hypothetical protein
MANEEPVVKVQDIDAGEAVAMQVREGQKSAAPANLVLPKPVAIPVAPSNKQGAEKK